MLCNFSRQLLFICGEYTVKSHQKSISDFLKKVYFAYFKSNLGDQDKPRAPHKVCSAISSVPHTSEIRVPHQPSSLDDIRSDSEHGDTIPHQDESNSDFSSDEGPQPFSQSYLNDLVKDLVLKAVLLHSGNSFASLPLGHSLHLEENYNDLSMILEKINYQEFRWMVCGDFKMLTMLLGQQAGRLRKISLLSMLVEQSNQ
ncbi:hypothetical protein AVEN_227764-1 [Araneus ventricosus]|uniref:Uncharacterized protein n=1 Tax=Araneus ventricosus TaxID=182803 RepID=A0A4Y2IUE4_ARAVE|nr:hypothetical protein AVEN_227764-1 [Araneus ventricosus]